MATIEFPKWIPKHSDITKNIDLMEGYESPITKIVNTMADEIVKRENDYLVEYVHQVGFDVDEIELKRALQYDRDSYAKGVKTGIEEGKMVVIDKCAEIVSSMVGICGLGCPIKCNWGSERTCKEFWIQYLTEQINNGN